MDDGWGYDARGATGVLLVDERTRPLVENVLREIERGEVWLDDDDEWVGSNHVVAATSEEALDRFIWEASPGGEYTFADIGYLEPGNTLPAGELSALSTDAEIGAYLERLRRLEEARARYGSLLDSIFRADVEGVRTLLALGEPATSTVSFEAGQPLMAKYGRRLGVQDGIDLETSPLNIAVGLRSALRRAELVRSHEVVMHDLTPADSIEWAKYGAIIDLMLNAGSDPNSPHLIKQPALNATHRSSALDLADLETMEKLARSGADVVSQGVSRLWASASSCGTNDRFLDIARALLKHGVDVNARPRSFGHVHERPLAVVTGKIRWMKENVRPFTKQIERCEAMAQVLRKHGARE